MPKAGRLFALILLAATACDRRADFGPPPGDGRLFTAGTPDLRSGSVQVYFNTGGPGARVPGDIASQCAAFVDSADRTLDVAAHEIDHPLIAAALIDAHRRGVAVRVVTDSDYLHSFGPLALRPEGIPVRGDGRSALMHDKFIVKDGHSVWTGSFNLTVAGAERNGNNAVVIEAPRVAANFAEKFRWFWDDHAFGGPPDGHHRIPSPVVQTPSGAIVETYFAPHDHLADHLIGLVGSAERSVHFLAYSFTHDRLADAMLERADAGVQVRGVCESRGISRYSEFDRLAAHANVSVRRDGNRYAMHHKVLIIDDAIVVTGSANFSESAMAENDENVVVIHDPLVAAAYLDEFARCYQTAAGSAQVIATSAR